MDIVFFAIVAGLVLARLYQVLGQNHGAPPPIAKDNLGSLPAEALRKANIANEIDDAPLLEPIDPLKDYQEKYGDLIAKISDLRTLDPNFDPLQFESQAGAAYEAILSAYSSGDEAALAPLVSDEVLGAYRELMAERANSGANRIDIVRLADPLIKDIEISNKLVSIDVNFSATLVEAPHSPRNTQEVWTFSRNLDSKDWVWRLIAVETA